ncbi:MAG: hypothetical protein ACFB6R_14990 [Alphaproteobacteria bacterium]
MKGAKREALSDLLGGLDPAEAALLAQATEYDRQCGADTLPHDLILDSIRPALQRLGRPMDRRLTPRRLFCKPFEDLLGAPTVSHKHRGRIARSSIGPVWDWLCHDLAPERMAGLCEKARQALISGDDQTIRDAGIRLCGFGGLVLSKTLETAPAGSPQAAALAGRLGGDRILEDARDMAMVLEISDDILAMLDGLPRPICDLEDTHMDLIRITYDTIVRELPDHAPFVIFVAMGRLSKPWEVLRLIGHLTNRATDTFVTETDLGACGALLLADIEDISAFFDALDPGTAQDADIVHQLDYFARLSKGMSLEMDIAREGTWGQRLTEARTRISGKMETVLDHARRHVEAALASAAQAGAGQAGASQGQGSSPDPQTRRLAVDKAHLLAQTRYFAESAAFSGPSGKVICELTDRLDELVGSISAAVGSTTPGESAERIKPQATLARDLCRALLDPEAAEIRVRRLTAALNTAE